MKLVFSRSTTRLLAGLALAGLASSAFAAETWTSTSFNQVTQPGANANNYGNSYVYAGTNTVGATATAWSSTSSGPAFATARLYDWGTSYGFGVTNRTEGGANATNPASPEHSTDNNGATDLVAFSFSSSVVLNSITLGWNQYDTDVSVLRYVGSANTLADAISGVNLSNLTAPSAGWKLVANLAGTGTTSESLTDITRTFNTTNSVSSSWWLVSAYNSGYGAATQTTGSTTPADGSDYVKILAVSGYKSPQGGQIPEPGSLALMGAALFGVIGLRRRKEQSALQAS